MRIARAWPTYDPEMLQPYTSVPRGIRGFVILPRRKRGGVRVTIFVNIHPSFPSSGREMFNANSSILQTLGHFSPSLRKPLQGILAKDCGEDSMSDGGS